MNALIPKQAEQVRGELSGWDRIVFRGYLRMLCFADGMMGYLYRAGVLLKDFGEHALARIYPQLVRGAIATFGSRDVLRFLGKRPNRNYQGEVVSDYKDRPEGVCVKHRAYGNSVKVYDKGGSLLRIETTITNPRAFQSYRSSESDPDGPKSWRPMRKGVADMHRRAKVRTRSETPGVDQRCRPGGGRIPQSRFGRPSIPVQVGQPERAWSNRLKGLLPSPYPSGARPDPQITRPPTRSPDNQGPPNRYRPTPDTTRNPATT